MAKYSQQKLHAQSIDDPTSFWADTVSSMDWSRKPSSTLRYSQQDPTTWQWFPDGELNMCHECLDKHVLAGRGDQPALIWESPLTLSSAVTLTYSRMLDRVQRFAGVLASLGVKKGDVVMIYMPMIPEAVIGMLACARLGAIHSVVFGGFASRELAKRIDSATPDVILLASCGIEEKRVTPYVPLVDEAIKYAQHKPRTCVLHQRPGHEHAIKQQEKGGARYVDWQEAEAGAAPVKECTPTGARDELYTLYTSGTTGAPKGVSRFSPSYAVHLKHSIKALMNLQPGQVMFCASDVGWVVGHTYIVYAPLLGGCASVLFEGKVPMRAGGEVWRICEQHSVNVLFCAPTALRALRTFDPDHKQIKKRKLKSLRNLMLAGERSEPSIVTAYESVLKSHIGEHFRVVDNYWSSESGSPITGVLQSLSDKPVGKPGSAGPMTPGYDLRIVDDNGQELKQGEEGNIVLKMPLPPSMLTELWRDSTGRFKSSYLKRFDGKWFDTGDAGKLDEDGFVHILSRSDDIINVAAHRLSTGAFEATIAALPGVSECCVVGMPDNIKGHVPVAFIVSTKEPDFGQVNAAVRGAIGNIASLGGVIWLSTPLPKTRSGKTIRKVCRSYLENAIAGEADKEVPVPATIEDPSVLSKVQEAVKQFVAKRGKAKL